MFFILPLLKNIFAMIAVQTTRINSAMHQGLAYASVGAVIGAICGAILYAGDSRVNRAVAIGAIGGFVVIGTVGYLLDYYSGVEPI